MKILLIYPVPPREYWPRGIFRSGSLPSGIAYIARSLINAGHDVRVHVREEQLVKCNLDWEYADEQLRKKLAVFMPDIVGLSILTPSMPEGGWIAELTKKICGMETMVVTGGVHPTALPEETLQDYPAIDVICVGEGETTLVELAEKGISSDVPGLVYRDSNKIVHTPKRKAVKELDTLGFPAYELFDMDYYTKPTRCLIRWIPLKTTNILTSRGCTNACKFCAGHLVGGVGVRYRSIEHVIEEIAMLVENYGFEALYFEDDTMGADLDRLQRLCQAFRKNGFDKLKWFCCLRVDQAKEEILKEMKASGCIQIEYGFESGSDAALKRLSKGASVELNRRAVSLTRNAGIRVFANIMFALPEETEQEFKATVDFVRWAKPDIINACCLSPLPGTPIYRNLPEEIKNTIEWGEYSYHEDLGIRINLSAIPTDRLRTLYHRFCRYIHRPHTIYSLLRDTPEHDSQSRKTFARRYRRFLLHHPIAAIRLPR